MREIKFRVWNKKVKRMYWWAEEYDEDDEEWTITLNNAGFYYNLAQAFKDKNLVLMQFTGLKDKNGKEIFEGDIVKVHDKEEEEEDFLGIFIFSEKHLRFEFDEKYLKKDTGFIWASNWVEYPCEYEVIGNKFENPELLDAKGRKRE